jgi:aerobic-type carbon monoxide dehydrogenase small subunit (CoxS/CutS family)
MELSFRINGEELALDVEPRELLLDVIRDRLGLTGAKRSCDVQVCGACTVLVDGHPVSSCCTLAHDVQGREVLTIEGFARTGELAAYEDAFVEHIASQCGYCTPGMILTVKALRDAGELPPDEDGVRRALSGSICRCTGYRAIIEAAMEIAGR